MLKNFSATLTAETEVAILTVPENNEAAVLSIEVFGGDNGGVLTFTRNNGTEDVFTWKISVESGNLLVFDHRQFFEAGNILKVLSDADGIMVSVNADVSEV
jgi:hypothetical protein